ncbi:RNA polymerase sigma factor [Chitinophaga pinensis]|nr:sigma factor [Chitinophaga pinensis]
MSGQVSEWDDNQLFREFQHGDTAAYGEIYRRFSAVLYQHACRMLDNDADAQDVVQEVFANLWTKGASLQINGSLGAYLYISTRNRVLNLISSQRSYQHHLDSLRQFISETDTSTIEHLPEKELISCIETRQIPRYSYRRFFLF